MRIKSIAKISKKLIKLMYYGVSTNHDNKTSDIIWKKILSNEKIDISSLTVSTGKHLDSDTIPTRNDFLGRNRLTSSQTQLLLLFHFICNSKGIAKDVRKKELADYLGLSLKTINRSIDGLIEFQIITIGNTKKGYLNYEITEYEKMFKKDSGGYYNLSEQNFTSLISQECVNHLRADLFMLYKSDFNPHYEKAILIDIKTMLTIAPSIAYKKAMKEYADKKSDICTKEMIGEEQNIILIYPTMTYDGKKVMEETEIKVHTELLPRLPGLDKKDKSDIESLAKEYGYQFVYDSINYLEGIHLIKTSGGKLGALIRNHLNIMMKLAEV